jgi:hypothetical protein
MMHLRIIGSLWLVSAFVPAVKLAIELWSLVTQPPIAPLGTEFCISQLLVETSFLVIILIGYSLWRPHRWALIAAAILGFISLLVCIWFILSQGMDHGPEPFVAIWCGVALSLYTLFGVWRFGVRSGPSESVASKAKPDGTVA